ncbi:Acyl-CoA hydrolase [Catalinimonas alkaloidigena]|uniref:Acyl-CoA hydrolase n=1 Tax=Catalinimonas alkaloidigena TaxID=1075417 RepID=A0A1G9QDE5_9BACT|nr:acyl-CoA thioesterase [Catalinimonas alkaloidigena]SDM09006.1 Acyl-CoA hydrolase [Catalinimonas alkaloidigena]
MENAQREMTLRFLAEPTEINFGGKVHGGTVMKWIDQAGYACAVGWSGRYCVTVYVGGIRFYHPVHIGDLVEVQAKLIYTGTTSMHIAVDVRAGDPKDPHMKKTTHCVIIFVGIDRDGKPVPVNRWEPKSEEDQSLQTYAQKLMNLRKSIEEEMREHRVE